MAAIIPSSYPDDWEEIAKRIKDKADWRCVRCGHPHETPNNLHPCDSRCKLNYHIEVPREGVIRIALQEKAKRGMFGDGRSWFAQRQRVLTVHHLDNDKSNCADWNLAALCQVCHLHIQAVLDVFEIDELPSNYDPAAGWLAPYLIGRRAALSPEVKK